MKKFYLLISVVVMAFCFSSCSTSVQVAKFTSVDKLYQLPMESTYEATTQILGCDPYNLLTKQADGYSIYVYKYKIVERKIKDASVLNDRGAEATGTDVYNPNMAEALLIFKDNKLKSIITDEGRKSSHSLVMFDNTLFEISKNRDGKYIIIPVSADVPKDAAGLSLPFGKKKKK